MTTKMTLSRAPTFLPHATLILYSLMILFASLRCALATDTSDSIPRDDHNHHRLQHPDTGLGVVEDNFPAQPMQEMTAEPTFVQYEAVFLGEDSGILGRRDLKENHSPLTNNAGFPSNILPGDEQYFQIEHSTIFGNKSDSGVGLPSPPFPAVEFSGSDDTTGDNDIRDPFKRQAADDGVVVYITINTCLQPLPNKALSTPFPQLTLYVTTTGTNIFPGPNVEDNNQIVLPLEQGFASMNITTKSEIYIAVLPPNLTDFTGQWNYEIAASIDAPYHNWNNWDPTPNSDPPWNPLLFVDSDTTSSLLVTQNFTSSNTSADINDKWKQFRNPFTLFAFSNASSIEGMSHSFCGISKAAEQLGKSPGNTTTSVVTRGIGGLPKGQFYITSLNGGSNYTVMMAMEGNSTVGGPGVVGGGGQVWPEITFSTKSNDNCALVFDLPFCSEVAWSVPSNPSMNLTELVGKYNNFTEYYYYQFNKSMQQVACNTTDTARYSLATDCQNCSSAYKDWLCAVTLPRCSDFAKVDAPDLGVVTGVGFPRNLAQAFPNGTTVTNASLTTDLTRAGLNESWLDRIYSNQSRFPTFIDQEIQPGPYLELLPCEDLCYSLVRNCPATMGFACPNEPALSRGYAPAGRCNSPGNVFFLSAGNTLAPSLRWLSLFVLVGVLIVGE